MPQSLYVKVDGCVEYTAAMARGRLVELTCNVQVAIWAGISLNY